MFSVACFLVCGIILSSHGFPCVPPPAKRSDYDDIVKWPQNTVPYEFDAEYTSEERLELTAGLAELSAMTDNCVQFVPRTDIHPAWVRIVSKSGCWSYVGKIKQTGYQELSLSRNGCLGRGVIKHEFLHALGFIHEQQRPDRDKYIKILYENIAPNAKGNYDKYKSYSAVNLGIPYDISFYMHYNNEGFSLNGMPTMVPILKESKQYRFSMGRPNGFDAKDALRIKKTFGCV